ncbi:hypothetical protein [Megalodesulfovibrio gigas]|nr:hypothetical protein [Megalodesulfovibrio gigas]
MTSPLPARDRRRTSPRTVWNLVALVGPAALIALIALAGLLIPAGLATAAPCADLFQQGASLRWERTASGGVIARGGLAVTALGQDGQVSAQRFTEGGNTPAPMRGSLQGDQLLLIDDATEEQWTGLCTEGGVEGRAGLDAVSMRKVGGSASAAAPLPLQSMTQPPATQQTPPTVGPGNTEGREGKGSITGTVKGGAGGVFTDAATGLRVTAPAGTTLTSMADAGKASGLTIAVDVLPLDRTAKGRSGLTTAQAKAEMQVLTGKEFGEAPGQAVHGSEELLILPGGTYAKAYAIFSRGEACDIRFEREVRFYTQNRQVSIVVAANAQEMATAAPQFFAVRPQCGQGLVWKNHQDAQAQQEFFAQARDGKLPGAPKAWADAFEAMLPGIAMLAEATAVPQQQPQQQQPQQQQQPSQQKPQTQKPQTPQPPQQQPPTSQQQPQSPQPPQYPQPPQVPAPPSAPGGPQQQPPLPRRPPGMPPSTVPGAPQGMPGAQAPGTMPMPVPPGHGGSFLSADQNRCRMIPADPLARGFQGKVMVPEQTFSLELPWYGPACFVTLAEPGATATGPHLYALLYSGQTLARLQPSPGMPLTRALAFEDFNADGYPEIIAIIDNLAARGARYRDNKVFWSMAQPNGGVRWIEQPEVTARIAELPNAQAVRQVLRRGQ